MASFSTNNSNSRFTLTLTCTERDISTESNTSIIDYTLTLKANTSYSFSQYAIGREIWINGERVYYAARSPKDQYSIDKYGTLTLASGNVTITHDDDGSKNIGVSYSIDMASASYTPGSLSGEGNMPLETIARASQPSCISYPNNTQNVGYFGNTITVHMNRKSTAFTHWIGVKFDDESDISWIGGGITDNTQFTLWDEWMQKIPNGTSLTGTIYVDTYNGTTKIGTKTCLFTMTVPENEKTKPSVAVSASAVNSWLTTTNPKYDDFKDLYIQGMSQVGVDITASGKYNATIESYLTSVDGKKYTTASSTSNKLAQTGTIAVTSSATDSRGFTKSVSESITVYPYTSPSVVPIDGQSKIVCTRCDSSGNPSSSGTKLKISAKRKFSPLVVDSTQLNTCVLYYCIKESTATSYGSWQTLIPSTISSTNEFSGAVSDVTLDVTKMYDIQIAVRDDLANWDIVAFSIPTEEIPLDLANGGLNVAIGRHAKTDGSRSFDCGWDANFEKNLGIKGKPIADFIVEQGSNETWTYRKWDSGIAECWTTSAIGIAVTENDWYVATSVSFYKLLPSVSFPFSFVAYPSVTVSGYQSTAQGINSILFSPCVGNEGLQTYSYCLVNKLAGNIHCNYHAIGKWK